MISRYRASRNHDASKPSGGDMMKALSHVKAKALLLPSMTDRTVPAYLTRELYKGIPRATYAEIPTIRGHSGGGLPAGTPEYAFITDHVRPFLDSLGN